MLNDKKELRAGRAVWRSYPMPRIAHAPLRRDANCDVAVIGAGISGAMVASELTEAGFSVILLDRRGPLKGSTSATTALLQYEIDTPITQLKRKIGEADAMRAWRRSKLGLESLAACVAELEIPCGLKRCRSLYLAGDVLDIGGLKKEMQMRRRAGLHTRYLSGVALQDEGINGGGALESFGSFSANPMHLAAGFLRHALVKGARLYAPMTVKDVEPHPRFVSLLTKQGPEVKARTVIFATGYEIPDHIRPDCHQVHSTWAIATRPQPASLPHPMPLIWEASDPYLYARATSDGRVICGGADEPFTDEDKRDALLPEKKALLERKLKRLLPGIDSKAEFAWTGAFGTSTTGLPTIGPVPGMLHCYAILAFGGNGITYSRIAAEMVRGYLTGRQDPDADLFAFT